MKHLNANETVSVYITGELNSTGELVRLQIGGKLLNCLEVVKSRFIDTNEIVQHNTVQEVIDYIVDELTDSEIIAVHKLKITPAATGKPQVYIKRIKPKAEIIYVS